MKKLILILVFLSIPFSGFSQEDGPGNWLVYIGSKQLNSKWNLHHEIQYRNYNAIGNLEQLLLRTGLGYQIGEKSNLLLGYGYINSENYTGDEDEKIILGKSSFRKSCFESRVSKNLLRNLFRLLYRLPLMTLT